MRPPPVSVHFSYPPIRLRDATPLENRRPTVPGFIYQPTASLLSPSLSFSRRAFPGIAPLKNDPYLSCQTTPSPYATNVHFQPFLVYRRSGSRECLNLPLSDPARVISASSRATGRQREKERGRGREEEGGGLERAREADRKGTRDPSLFQIGNADPRRTNFPLVRFLFLR